MIKIEITVYVSRPTLECTNGQDVYLVIDECSRSTIEHIPNMRNKNQSSNIAVKKSADLHLILCAFMNTKKILRNNIDVSGHA